MGLDLEIDDYTSEQPTPKLESKLHIVLVNQMAKFTGAVNYP